MRVVLDPVPLVLGIYAYVGQVLSHAVEKRRPAATTKRAKKKGAARGGRARPLAKSAR